MPLAEDLEKLVLRLVRLNSTMSTGQKEYFKSRGYTFLSPTQMDILKGRKRTRLFIRSSKLAYILLLFVPGPKRDTLFDGEFQEIAKEMEDDMERFINDFANQKKMGQHRFLKYLLV